MKTLPDWLVHLEGLHPKGQGGIELGLERVARVKAELQQRQSCPVIIVGGTNGKGSTCAYLEAIYSAAGYRVGCYTSPHLLDYNERVRVDGASIDDAALCAAFARVETARLAAGSVALTYFEFGTLAAWEVFAARQMQVIILEVGLGGRLDAVNIYDPDVAIVTGIALDHTDWLGPTRESIGFEKAGIFRPGKPAICADPQPPQSLIEHAAAISADLRLIGRDFGYVASVSEWSFWNCLGESRDGLPMPALRGVHQLGIAAAVLAVVDALQDRLPAPLQALQRGLREVRLAGRFQQVRERPAIILDVAHNPHAAAVLADNLEHMGGHRETYAVFGAMRDKDIEGIIACMKDHIDHWCVADLPLPRAASAHEISEKLLAAGVCQQANTGKSVQSFSSPAEALVNALSRAGENDRIAAFGSFWTVAGVMTAEKARHQ